MRKVALIVVVLLLAIAVVPAYADHPEPVSAGPLHCALEAPLGEAHGARNSGGPGGGDNTGGGPADPPAPQAGQGSHTGDGESNNHGKVCAALSN